MRENRLPASGDVFGSVAGAADFRSWNNIVAAAIGSEVKSVYDGP